MRRFFERLRTLLKREKKLKKASGLVMVANQRESISKSSAQKKKKKKKTRLYELYSRGSKAAELTNRYWAWVHPLHLHSWRFEVVAVSIKQAYFLAYQNEWASGPGEVGIRRIDLHPSLREMSAAEAIAEGLIIEAKYLGGSGGADRAPGRSRMV